MHKYRKEIDILKEDIRTAERELEILKALPERNHNGFRDLERANEMGRLSRKLRKMRGSMTAYVKIIMNN